MKKEIVCLLLVLLYGFSFFACNKDEKKELEVNPKIEKVKSENVVTEEVKSKSVVTEEDDVLKENPASDFRYTLTDDGAGVKITEYIGKSSKIIIPAEIEGLPVLEVEKLATRDHEYGNLFWNSALGEYVYPKNNVTITHIVFPDSVRSTVYGGWTGLSLSDFDALEYVKLPAGINLQIESWEMPESYLLDLSNCDKLKTVIIPEGSKYIPKLSGCTALESISFPSTIEYVSQAAFAECSNLKEITIPDNVEKISFAFYDWIESHNQFVGTNLNLSTQSKLKQLGYTGQF